MNIAKIQRFVVSCDEGISEIAIQDKEPKVLLIAFACEPGRGSEPGIGWGFVDEMSRRRPVWFIADEMFRKPIERYLETTHNAHQIHASFVNVPMMEWLKKSFLGMNIYYYLWQFFSARVGRRLHREIDFDLVQHVSFERYWMHSAAASVGPPFIFGPVGGGELWPSSMKQDMSARDRLQTWFWYAVRSIMEYDPFLRKTVRKAVAVIPSIEATGKHLRRLGATPLEPMMCLAPKPTLPAVQSGPSPGSLFRFVSIGRLPKWKGCHLGIKAFAKAFGPESSARDSNVEFLVIGTGSELTSLKALASNLGVGSKVRFLGDLPYQECLIHLASAGAMIHPIIRCSAGLVFESLMLGVPVICNDVGISSMVVNDSCGVVVNTERGPDHVIQSIASTLKEWTTNHNQYLLVRAGALERAKELSREKRGDRLDEIHRELIQQSRMGK